MTSENKMILVIDDDPDIGLMIKTMLEYHGFKVIVTEQAEKAISLIETENIGLLIMDMLLSGMYGTDICKAVKQQSEIPIIMISAHPNAREVCVLAGADDFISKPFDMEELIRKINQFLPS